MHDAIARLSSLAQKHGCSTTDIVRLNPHKEAVMVMGVGAVFTSLAPNEPIYVPDSGRPAIPGARFVGRGPINNGSATTQSVKVHPQAFGRGGIELVDCHLVCVTWCDSWCTTDATGYHCYQTNCKPECEMSC